MNVSVTAAKNQFAALCQAAKRCPVIIEKSGVPDSVLLSYAEYQQLLRPDASTEQVRRQQFVEQYGGWIDELNRSFDQHGVWNKNLTVW